MCRKPSFGTYGRWRLPESASACLIPCLSLCLACVERKRMVRRTVLPSRACAAALFSPSATRGGAAAPLHTERRRPASRSLSGIAPSKQESTTYEPLLIPDRLLARLFHQSKFQRHFGSGNRLRRSVGGCRSSGGGSDGFSKTWDALSRVRDFMVRRNQAHRRVA